MTGFVELYLTQITDSYQVKMETVGGTASLFTVKDRLTVMGTN